MSRHTCEAVGCSAAILPTELFCGRHLQMLESDLRRILERKYRPKARHQTQIFTLTLEKARHEILYRQTTGHPVPRDRPFEWDDPTEGGNGDGIPS